MKNYDNIPIPIIGIAGKARAGKDEVASILREYTGYESYALAKPIKDCINEIFVLGDKHAYGDLKEKVVLMIVPRKRKVVRIIRKYIGSDIKSAYYNDDNSLFNAFVRIVCNGNRWFTKTSPRILYQKFGTDFARGLFNDSIWFDIAPQRGIIISDVRFENEAKWVRDLGGKIIHVERENMPETVVAVHSSENGIKKFDGDYKINNVDGPYWKTVMEHCVQDFIYNEKDIKLRKTLKKWSKYSD